MSIFVSASSLKDYIKCSQMAYYRIFEPDKAIPSVDMKVGKIVHKVLEKEWHDKDRALAYSNTLLDNTTGPVQISSIEHFINTYFDHFSGLVGSNDKIEKRFKLPLFEDVYLVGVFDRITPDGIIYDWKTDSNPPKNIDKEVQFIIYDLAFRMLNDGREAGGLYLAALKDGSLVRYNTSVIHFDTLIGKIVPDFIDAVKNKKFVRTGLFSGGCYRCQYKESCLRG